MGCIMGVRHGGASWGCVMGCVMGVRLKGASWGCVMGCVTGASWECLWGAYGDASWECVMGVRHGVLMGMRHGSASWGAYGDASWECVMGCLWGCVVGVRHGSASWECVIGVSCGSFCLPLCFTFPRECKMHSGCVVKYLKPLPASYFSLSMNDSSHSPERSQQWRQLQ